MKILGIETSCDETAISIIKVGPRYDKIRVLSNIVSSQIKLHAKYGGVVPALAAREHAKNIGHVFQVALKKAGIRDFKKEIDLIAVTRGPGLSPALLIGLTFAKTLAWATKTPIIGVNHMDGHVHSNWLTPVASSKPKAQSQKLQNVFPALNLIVSGGHTELVLMRNHGKYKIIGETLDDAVGEAFDKVARLLGLGYPGGPAVATRAALSTTRYSPSTIHLPRPMLKSKDFNFSYSGLKTAVLYLIRDIKAAGHRLDDKTINAICYEFQKAAIEPLVVKALRAAEKYKVKAILLSGGVSANTYLRSELAKKSAESGIKYFQPAMEYTTDNAAMIAAAGYFAYKATRNKKTLRYDNVSMDPNLTFDYRA